jgi:hypothetical protein
MNNLVAAVKRTQQPTIADYRTAAEILQGAIKRRQPQQLYQRFQSGSRVNYDVATLKQMAKPYLLKELKKAWSTAIYSYTLYQKPSNKLKKHEIYHELLNVNHDFSSIPRSR